MGFERLLRVLEGVATNFDTSLFRPLLGRICDLSGREYGKDRMDDIRMRRIADHVRAAVFCISDGVRPSNEKQGYVVRKVLRRAVMDGRNLDLRDLFLHELVETVINSMKGGYPELEEQRSRIEREVRLEEEKFAEAYLQGSARLSVFLGEMEEKKETVLDGKSAFLLYDTFGFPLDLARRTLEEQGYTLDFEGFNTEMEAQRERARKGSKISDQVFDTGPLGSVKADTPPTLFCGYEKMASKCRILRILTEDGLVEKAGEGQRASIVLNETPFYAEAGGQVGDHGVIRSETFTFTVDGGTHRDGDYHIHRGIVTEGTVARGALCEARVDAKKRAATQRNHTATHLLHYHLRKVLGPHVEQAGSLVEPYRLRFDFLHHAPLKPAEIERIQNEVNAMIRSDLEVGTAVMDLDAARKEGAMALFGEKYAEKVRVVTIHDGDGDATSKELCGGTHVRHTGEIGGFRIISEESIAAGVRRIEAATGEGLEALIDRKLKILKEAAQLVKTGEEELLHAILSLQDQSKELRRELKVFRAAGAEDALRTIMERGRRFPGGMVFYSGRVDGLPVEEVRKMSDAIRGKSNEPTGLVLISVDGEKVHIVAAFDEAFQERGLRAGDVCRNLGKTLGGGGGGKPGMAQGQGKDAAKADPALEQVCEKIIQTLEG
jgi:alanyl-tRNA synthetase